METERATSKQIQRTRFNCGSPSIFFSARAQSHQDEAFHVRRQFYGPIDLSGHRNALEVFSTREVRWLRSLQPSIERRAPRRHRFWLKHKTSQVNARTSHLLCHWKRLDMLTRIAADVILSVRSYNDQTLVFFHPLQKVLQAGLTRPPTLKTDDALPGLVRGLCCGRPFLRVFLCAPGSAAGCHHPVANG